MHWSKNPQIRNTIIQKIATSRKGKGLHTIEWKLQQSTRLQGNTYGFKKGIPQTEKWKKLMSKRMKGNSYGFKKNEHPGKEFQKGFKPWNTGLAETGICKAWNKGLKGIMTEATKDKIRKGVIEHLTKRQLKQDTGIELKMKAILESRNILFQHPYKFNDKFLCDFSLPEYKIIIECDGDYWHNREDIKKRDYAKNQYITTCNWTILRFWEHEINGNLDHCLNKIIFEMKRKSDLYGDIKNAVEISASSLNREMSNKNDTYDNLDGF